MSGLTVGNKLPANLVFSYVPYTTDDAKVCGRPINYDASKEWAGKKVVIVAVPGAFTPGCSHNHIPPYITQLSSLHQKGVDIVAVIAFNDAFVMSAWSKVNGVKNDDILFLADTESKFSEKIGWTMGDTGRAARYAVVVDDGKVVYAEKEGSPGEVTVSGVEAVLAKL